MDQDTKNNKLSESIEFLADFQLLFGNIIRINGAFLEVAEKICSNDELITVPIWRVIAVIRINPMTVPEVAKYLGISILGRKLAPNPRKLASPAHVFKPPQLN